MKKNNRSPLHNRNIFLKGFLRHDNLYDIEAELIDTKHYSIPNKDRDTKITNSDKGKKSQFFVIKEQRKNGCF